MFGSWVVPELAARVEQYLELARGEAGHAQWLAAGHGDAHGLVLDVGHRRHRVEMGLQRQLVPALAARHLSATKEERKTPKKKSQYLSVNRVFFWGGGLFCPDRLGYRRDRLVETQVLSEFTRLHRIGLGFAFGLRADLEAVEIRVEGAVVVDAGDEAHGHFDVGAAHDVDVVVDVQSDAVATYTSHRHPRRKETPINRGVRIFGKLAPRRSKTHSPMQTR